MKIRIFKESDTAAVSALWQEVFPYDPPHSAAAVAINQKLECQPELFFVGEIDGQVIGTMLCGYDGHRGWLYLLAIDPAHRRKKLATELLRHAEHELMARGCTKINLQTRTANAAAIGFYHAMGYELEELVSMGKRFAHAVTTS
ncbi:GNAT family acetyltransferase [Undibacterium terreum]|uniref:GNAT family acetyltransferase n=1 Tax=Undibacterium terreum TaxID=1224302 RepID=A0A916XCC7_9BURK|nr:GNAT family acetyltransferase [Undibacterium terreum]GGC63536.1 GNAT family acetyltransferase [Undibacterium terreum]